MGDKTQDNRGSNSHGRGSTKNGRGKGEKGGSGKAGSFKHERLYWSKRGYRRGPEKGFNRPESLVEEPETVNVGYLDERIDEFGEEADDGWEVDLDELGVDRLLGKGKVLNSLRVHVGHATEKARAKIEAQGGEVVETDTADEEDGEDSSDEE